MSYKVGAVLLGKLCLLAFVLPGCRGTPREEYEQKVREVEGVQELYGRMERGI